MCKEWPGARCAGHTGANYTSAKDQTRKAARALIEANEALDAALANPDVSGADMASAQLKVAHAKERLETAQDTEQKAKEVWASTPGGRAALEREYAVLLAQGDKEVADGILKTLEAGEEIRRYREEAQKIAVVAFKNVQATSAEVKEEIAQKQALVDAHQNNLLKAHGNISSRSSKLQEVRKEAVSAQTAARRSLKAVRTAQERVHNLLVKAYVEAGVDQKLAQHYASDSIADMDKGYEHFSATPGDKFPLFKDNVEVKLKSGNAGTYAALRNLAEDKRYIAATESLTKAVSQHHESVSTLKAAKQAVQTIDNDLYNSVKDVTPESEAVTKLREEILETKALHATGIADQKTFPVGFSGFVKSSYKNPDGSSNALVRLENVGGGLPGYVQVDKVVRDDKNPHVVLRNGIKMSVEELKTATIKLLPPQKGARKLVQ